MSKNSKSHVFNEISLKDPRFSDWLQKIDSKTKAQCKLCFAVIDISSVGVSALNSHAKGNKHKQIISRRNTDSMLFFSKSSSAAKQSVPQSSKQSTGRSLVTGISSINVEILWTLKVVKSHFSFH